MTTDIAVESAARPQTTEPITPPADSQPRRRPTRAQLLGGASLLLLILLPIPFGDFGYFVGQFGAIYAILGLSVIVVTGYTGLISLMPYSFAGIGAVTAAGAMASWGWPFWLTIPLAALATVPISILVGVASVRLKPLYLAIATLTFANVLGETFFKWDQATGGQAGWIVDRPAVGPVDFSSDLSFYVLCIGAVLILLWMVEGLRTSRMGRAMLAVRDNELEAQAIGINVYKTKLVSFIIGGMLGGIGGAFLALLLGSVTRSAFQSPLAEANSLLLVTLVAIGGMDRAIGAFFGAISLVVQQQVFQGAEFFFAFFGIYAACLLIAFLLFRPGGLVQVLDILVDLVRRRPVFGSAVAFGLLALNVGVAWLFIALS